MLTCEISHMLVKRRKKRTWQQTAHGSMGDLRSRSEACEWVRTTMYIAVITSYTTYSYHINDGISKHQGAAIQMSDKKKIGDEILPSD